MDEGDTSGSAESGDRMHGDVHDEVASGMHDEVHDGAETVAMHEKDEETVAVEMHVEVGERVHDDVDDKVDCGVHRDVRMLCKVNVV